MDNKKIIMKIFFGLFIIFIRLIGESLGFPGHDCTEPCLTQMQIELQNMEEMPGNNVAAAGGEGSSSATLSWSKILKNSQNKDVMEGFFNKICTSYENVDSCLAECEARSNSGVNIRQTYAGLKFICKDIRADFFAALPCLAEFEPVAMTKCTSEISQSHATTAQFTKLIQDRELHSIRSKFRSLCADLSTMITCMEPVIRNGCGDIPTNMMLKFITLEFTSFEQLYGQLGFAEPLPSPCRTLLSMPTDPIAAEKPYPVANEIVFDQEAYANYNSFHSNQRLSLLKVITLVLILFMLN